MYCLFFLLASFFLCDISAETDPIEKILKEYFNSESLQRFRKEWEIHRKPIEHAISTALQETVGVPGLNVYINKMKEKLASGYFHTDNQVRLILSDLNLEEGPRCLLPDVQLSLASNVLKIQTPLTKMIIHADYSLIRNKSDIVYEPKAKNTLKTSPFLFEQVQESGKVAITMESCTLSGFIMTILNGESVNLGYDHFKFYNCTYIIENRSADRYFGTMENRKYPELSEPNFPFYFYFVVRTFVIYRPGEDSPPVIAPYQLYRGQGLGLSHLLMKPLLTEELVPKLQAAMFSFVNTSALFGKAIEQYRENQEEVFKATEKHFTDLIRKLNRITVEKNQGAIEMEDYDMYWDDERIKPSHKNQYIGGESMTLQDMVLTGLDTMYSAHCGGPFKIERILMADEIRFSSLQIRGKIKVKSIWSNTFTFAVEINDMAVDLQMGELQRDKGNDKKSKRGSAGFKRFEVTGLRSLIFAVPTLIFGPAESLISGYLSYEVPKLLRSHLSAIFSEATSKDPKITVLDNEDSLSPADSGCIIDDHDSAETDPKSESIYDVGDLAKTDPKSESIPLTDSEDVYYRELKGQRDRDIFKKNKKRFKSANRPRRLRRYGSRKRVADNQIRKK